MHNTQASEPLDLNELERLARAAQEEATVCRHVRERVEFARVLTPQTVLELIRMARDGYSRALRDIREGMEIAQQEGLEPECPMGCAARGYAYGVPGCPVHDPTAIP